MGFHMLYFILLLLFLIILFIILFLLLNILFFNSPQLFFQTLNIQPQPTHLHNCLLYQFILAVHIMLIGHCHFFGHVVVNTYGLVVVFIIFYDVIITTITWQTQTIHSGHLIRQEILLTVQQKPQLSYPILQRINLEQTL